MYPHGRAQHSLPHINIPHHSDTFVTSDEPSLTLLITQSPELTLGFTLGVVPSMDLDKHIITRISHQSIIQNSFTALKFLCARPIHASLSAAF